MCEINPASVRGVHFHKPKNIEKEKNNFRCDAIKSETYECIRIEVQCCICNIILRK